MILGGINKRLNIVVGDQARAADLYLTEKHPDVMASNSALTVAELATHLI